MFPKDHIVFDSNYIVLIVSIMVIQILEDAQFHTSLVLKLLLVSDYLDSNLLFSFVIEAFDRLAK